MPSFDNPISVFSFVLLIGLGLMGLLYILMFYLSFKKITHQIMNQYTENPFVSVIVCAKNAGHLLQDTVKSILTRIIKIMSSSSSMTLALMIVSNH